MKNILVPTDFSKNATDAAHYAAALANTTGARLLLFHAYHFSVNLTDTEEPAIDLDLENFENLNQTQIDQLAYDLHQTYNISVTRIMRPGFAADEISGLAKRLQADLVVMGMRGKGEAAGSSLGKITESILQENNIPVLCVPTGFVFKPYATLNFTYHSASLNAHPVTSALQKLENIFGALVKITPKQKNALNLQPAGCEVSPAASFPDLLYSGIPVDTGSVLTNKTLVYTPSEPSYLLIFKSDTEALQDIVAQAHLTQNSAATRQLPVLALPDPE